MVLVVQCIWSVYSFVLIIYTTYHHLKGKQTFTIESQQTDLDIQSEYQNFIAQERMRIYVEDYFLNEVRDAERTTAGVTEATPQKITKEEVEQFINEQVPTIPYEIKVMPGQTT